MFAYAIPDFQAAILLPHMAVDARNLENLQRSSGTSPILTEIRGGALAQRARPLHHKWPRIARRPDGLDHWTTVRAEKVFQLQIFSRPRRVEYRRSAWRLIHTPATEWSGLFPPSIHVVRPCQSSQVHAGFPSRLLHRTERPFTSRNR